MENLEQSPAQPVLLEKRSGAITTLVMNRPHRLNAINNDLATALNEALARISMDPRVHVVVLTGTGRAFCAGGDLGAIAQGRESGDSGSVEPMLRAGMRAVLSMRSMPQPVIAAVNGPAAGAGMNLALAADIRIAADEAVFGQNFAKVGLFPDYGGTFFLPELAGPAAAAELFYTGEMIDSRNALRLGLVNRVVAGTQLESEVRTLATSIANGPQVAIRAMKSALFGSQLERLQAALEKEVVNQIKCFETADCLEGIRAFLEKRSPKFQGR
jgi:2-(1,2-epoxy-1,2-dihydrophenyl)acetyl-CoA isomerase